MLPSPTPSSRTAGMLSTTASPSPLPILLLDFDGTVYRGDGPVLAYAQAVFDQLPGGSGPEAMKALRAFLAREARSGAGSAAAREATDDPAPSGPEGGTIRIPDDASDGYEFVRTIAEAHLDAHRLGAAYLASRRALAEGPEEFAIEATPGVAELLGRLAGRVERVLLTNSPEIGVGATIERIGLDGLFDQVVVNAGKPARMDWHLDKLLGGVAAQDAHRLMSVGDHWPNDIEVPLARGCATAHVSARPSRPAHLSGPSFEDLAAGILAWAADPLGFPARYPIRAHEHFAEREAVHG